MNIKPIRNDDDYRTTLAEIERLWGSPAGSDDGDRLDVLTMLVDKYENGRWPIHEPDWDPVDVLHYAIAEMGHTQAELSELLGSRSRASEILNRQRALTVDMIYCISEGWKDSCSLVGQALQGACRSLNSDHGRLMPSLDCEDYGDLWSLKALLP